MAAGSIDHAQALRSNGLSVTAQRLALLDAVHSHPHATADDLHQAVVAELASVSRQSVYNGLSALTETGIVRRIQPAGSSALYEARVGDNHHHVICRYCGEVADVDCAVGQRPCLSASNPGGFAIDEAEVIYWGLCPTCQDSSQSPVPTPNRSNKPPQETRT